MPKQDVDWKIYFSLIFVLVSWLLYFEALSLSLPANFTAKKYLFQEIRQTRYDFETLCNDQKITVFRTKKKSTIDVRVERIGQTSGQFSARDARSHKIPDNVFAWGCFSQSVSSLDNSIDEGYRIKRNLQTGFRKRFFSIVIESAASLSFSRLSLSLSLSWRGREIFTKISHQVRLRWVYYILGINLTIIINN